jgi:hypothetical protein
MTLGRIQVALDGWSRFRSYDRIAWDRIEDLHCQLAKAADSVAVETSGPEGWRLLIPGEHSMSVVHCLPVFHNEAWYLTTRAHAVDRSEVYLVGNPDHWTRAMVWTIAVAKALEPYGIESTEAVADLRSRMALQRELQSIAAGLMPGLARAYEDVIGKPLAWPLYSIGASSAPLGEGKVGLSVSPGGGRDYTVITVHPKAFAKPDYLREIVRHELIHTVIDPDLQTDAHDEVFQQIAAAAGLPKRYRD